MQKLQFYTVNAVFPQAAEIADRILHHGGRLPGKAENYVGDHGQTGVMESLKSVFEDGQRVAAANEARCFLVNRLQAQFHPDRFYAV